MKLSRVTWLVVATTLTLVAAVSVAGVLFVNEVTERLPDGGATARPGVVNVGSGNGPRGARSGAAAPGGATAPTPSGAQHAGGPAAGGVGSPQPSGQVPSTRRERGGGAQPPTSQPTTPAVAQYSDTVDLLNAEVR